ncbi:penicillin-binding transpeptidase domain-containing protein [Phytohabitans sp. ZYX-F-186]|uniref:Penicillin-binding transpeptidase domain-containing protein n=1 Tax=Phytohabitans maris TaxID=3071409 RepID=A0ABU0ZBS5_9ACTN|nr:penicillin-binding transpeptidase domain-containing protein [Phytohabitans sp. ZYX-F-186]MDQ7904518.1 penicillin-binding transpeptidase domain-containing protein [Phytohabitans sp. ZYX-F-186]
MPQRPSGSSGSGPRGAGTRREDQRPEEAAPRRGSEEPRRGSTHGTDAPRRGGKPEADPPGERGFGISEARAYTPRGRTVRERTPRTGRTTDPFRPALQVVEGGKPRAPRRPAPEEQPRGGNGRAAAGGTGRAGGNGGRTGGNSRQRAEQPAGRTEAPPRVRRKSTTAAVPAPRKRTTAAKASAAAKRPPAPRKRAPRRPPRLMDQRRRLRLGTVLALTVFATIGIRIVTMQFTESPAFAEKGLQTRLDRVDLPAPRGAIYDRGGAVLAHSVEARYVAVDPELVTDLEKTAAALQPLIAVPKSELIAKMAKRQQPGGGPSRFEYLARGVSIADGQRVEALDLAGIIVDRDERRQVPGQDLAASIIGFTSQDLNGLEGLEARYDDLLRGVDGKRVFEVGQGSLNAEIPGGYNRTTEAQPGSSLQLTIDRDLQYFVQKTLAERMAQAKAYTGAAVVLDVRTGEVLAQASYPTYDAAQPLKSKAEDREDTATSFVVDPGSVHKAITIGAALQEGAVKPTDTFVVGPRVRKGDQWFKDTHTNWTPKRMSIPGILAYSSNVGTIAIADKLGKEKLYEYQKKFGLGTATGVGVPGEASGLLLPPGKWSGSSYGSVPIGHSVAVTPLQMAAAYAAIANDGTWVQPHLVKETIAPDGKRTPTAPPVTRQVLSPENAQTLRQMLEAVTSVEGATGVRAAVDGYRVAGKTGTGSRVVNGQYVSGSVASFVGMAPAENPRYVIAVFAHTPAGGGGEVTAPAFHDMMGYALTHFGVPASSGKPPKFVVYP